MSFEKRVDFDPKDEFFGDSPNVFVGRYGYPDVNVGILSTEDYEHHDDPKYWSEKETPIGNIVDMRSVMVNSTFKMNAKSFDEKFRDVSEEVAMASKPVDVEINLEDKPEFKLSTNQDLMPQGPSVKLEKARITENPKVPRQVEKAVYDDEWKAQDAITTLYDKNIDEHHLTKLLSIGNLGHKTERKLVPTRWSITAVDSNLSKDLREEVKDYQEYDFVAHFGGHYGNYFLILFFPEVWSYELIETFVGNQDVIQNGNWRSASDCEGYDGRTSYVDETAGAYYATRLALLEYLQNKKRQASCLVLRFITNEYTVPLGVWVVREGVRKALESEPLKFASKKLMLEYARKLVKKKFWQFPLDNLLKNSWLLKELEEQDKLNDYL